MKYILLPFFTAFILITTPCFALICPTPAQVKAGDFLGFSPIDIDNDEPVSPAMIQYFKQHVDHFWLAEWMPGTLYPSHCYYRLDDQYGWSQTYLGDKQSIEPHGPYWKKSAGKMQCDKSVEACVFNNIYSPPVKIANWLAS